MCFHAYPALSVRRFAGCCAGRLCAKLGSSSAEHAEAFATYFAHNWEHQARLEILSDGSAIVTLSRLIQPF